MFKRLTFIYYFLINFLFLAFLFLILPSKVAAKWENCDSVSIAPGIFTETNDLTIRSDSIQAGNNYKVNIDGPGKNIDKTGVKANTQGEITIPLGQYELDKPGDYEVKLEYPDGGNICRGFFYLQPASVEYCDQWTINQANPTVNNQIQINGPSSSSAPDIKIKVFRNGKEKTIGTSGAQYTPTEEGDYVFKIYSKGKLLCQIIVNVGTTGAAGKGIISASPALTEIANVIEDLCQNNPQCLACFAAGKVWTALGCINTQDTNQFVSQVLGIVIKIAGGIAFLLIIFGAIKVLTSAGNPENVKAGQELITSALMGLLFILFSVFLLELIGVKILNIPGFKK